MSYPILELNGSQTNSYTLNKTGALQNAYMPLLNLITKDDIGDFTTPGLNFDPHNPVDIIVTDEYDGSQNLIINDDVNDPRLINTRLSVLENHTFLIPEHSGNTVTNVYDDNTLDRDISLLKLYNTIPTLTFNGLVEGGSFPCGSYVFYFKLSDADGNMTNTIQESGIVQMHIGPINSPKVRMGMQDENSEKSASFTLEGIDAGFDYIRVFYERVSSDNSGAVVPLYYMIDLNFPIINGKAELTLTGEEQTLSVSKSDIQNEFADISAAKTQTVLHNILFLGNTQGYMQDHTALQQLAWKIIPREIETEDLVGGLSGDYDLMSVQGSQQGIYYNTKNVYKYTGYWPDEYYRFGVVFIFDNNLVSNVFNILGVDFNKLKNGIDYTSVFIPDKKDPYQNEPENYIFDENYMTNSKGVVKFSKRCLFNGVKDTFIPKTVGIEFDLSNITAGLKDFSGDSHAYLKSLHIKGLFFVRQKRIPSIIAQGMVIGLADKDHGSIPVVKNDKGSWVTFSFLNSQRLLAKEGSEVEITSKVKRQALLIPDFELNTATYNQLFTGQDFALEKVANVGLKSDTKNLWPEDYQPATSDLYLSKVTAVPQNSQVKTDGKNYFATLAGIPEEPYKTEDVNFTWNKTAPQHLTTSTSVIRGLWGSYVGISYDGFLYGDIVNIKSDEALNNPNYNLIEFQKRFNDSNFYSAISPRYNYNEASTYLCYRGDCFPSMFTHRMMSNFADPELPTNHKIVDPGCWAKNYAVRCTAEILATTHSNLTDDSAGWYIPSPVNKKSNVVSLIFGILTGNIGTVIQAVEGMTDDNRPYQSEYANEIATAFEVYVGDTVSEEASNKAKDRTYDPTIYTDNDGKLINSLYDTVSAGYIKKVNPKEQETNATGLNLKAIFKSDDKWELHGLSQINRADVNAVALGQWVTFPICSSANLAFRDMDFTQATEEAKFNRKRSFYPLEEKDPQNPLFESQVINGACRRSGATVKLPAYRTTPFVKQEFFNRIYWSKPNVSEQIINSYRMIFRDQYREYNKEFGAITKLESLGDNLVVIFQHGIGLLPVNRSIGSEADATPYLASRNVLPAQVSIVTPDYGSMWKDSVLKVPDAPVIFGVDTVARKIWILSTEGIKFISDHIVTKFLNDFIDLSEYDFEEYQGHINVKTHYNAFKKDVIFTYYKDIPERDSEGKITKWTKGTTWSLCYNLVTQTFTTFYDWYPIESCNVDNIHFSFDKDLIESVLNQTNTDVIIERIPELESDTVPFELISKVIVDPLFSEKLKKYYYNGKSNLSISDKPGYTTYICLYSQKPVSGHWESIDLHTEDTGWTFYYTTDYQYFQLNKGEYYDVKVVHIKDGISDNITDKWPETGFNLRNSIPNRMLLWKHGQAGLYDNQGKIKPTHWYGKQHEFNFEFVVNENPVKQKIFNNLKILANKAAPAKFEYEVVGEGYEWFEYKPIVEWINKKAKENFDLDYWYLQVLDKDSETISTAYSDFPSLFDESRVIKKLPYLKMKHTDKKGTPERPHYKWDGGQTYWSGLSSDVREDKYSYNCSEPCFIEDDQLNETRIRTEQLGNDMKKHGRIRGNMQYLEDLWDVEIRPIQITWCYKNNDELKFKKLPETRHRDKYIKVKVRYSGEDLALILAIYTIFDESYA